jgi:hypothetical protein
VQEMQRLLAELGMELRSPAEIHAEIRVADKDVADHMYYWQKLLELGGNLQIMTVNVNLHFMASFIRVALMNNMEARAQAGEDEQGAFIHLSAKEKQYVIL